VSIEHLFKNNFSQKSLSNHINVDLSKLRFNANDYFMECELKQIEDSIHLVKQEDLDLIYSETSDYMYKFNYSRISKDEILFYFAEMMGYDSIIHCLANIKKSIAVDLDGTLAIFDGWRGISYIGEPIDSVVERAYQKEKEGYEIVIYTARANDSRSIPIIRNWLRNHNLPNWRITDKKDSSMKEIWDDLAIRVPRNKGFSNKEA
jgi:hypothetical protein